MVSNKSDVGLNFEGIKNNATGQDVRTDDRLRWALVEVGINEGEAYNIDQFFHNDIPTAKLSYYQAKWIIGYYDCISTWLYASTKNRRSGKKYDWTPLILKAYERAKTLAIVSKAEDGWITLNVLKREMVQHYSEQSNQKFTQEKPAGFFGQKNKSDDVETNNYTRFERS